MEARGQAPHIDKVLDIEELEGSVPRMLCGAHGAREMHYQLFSIQDDHARVTQPGRRTVEAPRTRHGCVRRWVWLPPRPYTGGNIDGLLRAAWLRQ